MSRHAAEWSHKRRYQDDKYQMFRSWPDFFGNGRHVLGGWTGKIQELT